MSFFEAPSADANQKSGPALSRASLPIEFINDQFNIGTKEFKEQYSHVYFARLAILRPRALKAAKTNWGASVPILSKILDIEPGKECAIACTLLKTLKNRPNVLDDFSDEYIISPETRVIASSFVSDGDYAEGEDESGRIRVDGLDLNKVVTGVVIALRGTEDANGVFRVSDFCWPDAAPSRAIPSKNGNARKIVLVSGIGAGGDASSPLALQILADFLVGAAGGDDDASAAAAVGAVIVAGDLYAKGVVDGNEPGSYLPSAPGSNLASIDRASDELDAWLSELASSVRVAVIPGAADPTNYTLPQQPLSASLLPHVSSFSTFARSSNPFVASVDGMVVCGTAGQPVADMARSVAETEPHALLEMCLRAGHFAPTAPDTLACYPFAHDDPLLLPAHPRVLFAGNQSTFKATQVSLPGSSSETLVVSVPRFDESHAAVVVNLDTLECELVRVDVALASP